MQTVNKIIVIATIVALLSLAIDVSPTQACSTNSRGQTNPNGQTTPSSSASDLGKLLDEYKTALAKTPQVPKEVEDAVAKINAAISKM